MKVLAENADELVISSPAGCARVAGAGLLIFGLEMALFGLLGSHRQPSGREPREGIIAGLVIALALVGAGIGVILASSDTRFRFDGKQRKLFITARKVTKSLDFDEISDAIAVCDRHYRDDDASYSLYLILYGSRSKIEISPYRSSFQRYEYEHFADLINAFLRAHPAPAQ